MHWIEIGHVSLVVLGREIDIHSYHSSAISSMPRRMIADVTIAANGHYNLFTVEFVRDIRGGVTTKPLSLPSPIPYKVYDGYEAVLFIMAMHFNDYWLLAGGHDYLSRPGSDYAPRVYEPVEEVRQWFKV